MKEVMRAKGLMLIFGRAPGMMNLNIETLIPHRNSMRLVEEIIEIEDSRCVTASTVKNDWPLVEKGYANPIVLIELAAQTAGVHFGWQESRKARPSGMLGWLVGIKAVQFHWDRIAEGTRIVVSIEDRKSNHVYAEIIGTATVGSECIAEIELQVYRPEENNASEGQPS